MRLVLGIATVLGIVGPIASFGLFYLGDRAFHLDGPHRQTLAYLMLSVAGHLTIFQTRTRGPFWPIRPAPVLWVAVLGTQLVATLIAVYGFLMTPIGWGWAAFVWGYALVWFFLTDPVKLLAYRILDPPHDNAESAARLKPQAIRKAPPEGNLRIATDLKPQIAMRARMSCMYSEAARMVERFRIGRLRRARSARSVRPNESMRTM